jgi:hypothetical protein
VFIHPFSLFLWLSVLLHLPHFQFGFLSSFVSPLLFSPYFISVFLAYVVSSLGYPNLLGTKRFDDCCCCYYCYDNVLVKLQSGIGSSCQHLSILAWLIMLDACKLFFLKEQFCSA